MAAQEGRFKDEGWRLRKGGSRFWADVVITPIIDDTGQLRGFAKVTRDLTERKRTEEGLRQSEELFRHTFNNAPIGMSMVSLDTGSCASTQPSATCSAHPGCWPRAPS